MRLVDGLPGSQFSTEFHLINQQDPAILVYGTVKHTWSRLNIKSSNVAMVPIRLYE